MQTLDAIFTRRSIRKFQDKKIKEDILEKILKAGMSAPSAMNSQPWHFVKIDEKNILKEIASFCPYAQMCTQSPMSILVCSDLTLSYEDYWIQDCAASVQNLLLASHELNLGAVWTGVYSNKERVEKFKTLLKLPNNIIPFALIVLGYPNETPHKKENFKKERIHYNGW